MIFSQKQARYWDSLIFIAVGLCYSNPRNTKHMGIYFKFPSHCSAGFVGLDKAESRCGRGHVPFLRYSLLSSCETVSFFMIAIWNCSLFEWSYLTWKDAFWISGPFSGLKNVFNSWLERWTLIYNTECRFFIQWSRFTPDAHQCFACPSDFLIFDELGQLFFTIHNGAFILSSIEWVNISMKILDFAFERKK